VKLIIEFEVDESFSVGKFGRLVNFAKKLGAKFKTLKEENNERKGKTTFKR